MATEEWRILISDDSGTGGGESLMGGGASASESKEEIPQQQKTFYENFDQYWKGWKPFLVLGGLLYGMYKSSQVVQKTTEAFFTIFQAIMDVILVPLMPLFVAIMEAIVPLIPKIQYLADQFFTPIVNALLPFVDKFVKWTETIDWKKVGEDVAKFGTSIANGIGNVYNWFSNHWDDISGLAGKLSTIWGGEGNFFQHLKDSWDEIWNSDLMKPVREGWQLLTYNIENQWKWLINEWLPWAWGKLINGDIATQFKYLVDALIIIFKPFGLIEGVIKLWNDYKANNEWENKAAPKNPGWASEIPDEIKKQRAIQSQLAGNTPTDIAPEVTQALANSKIALDSAKTEYEAIFIKTRTFDEWLDWTGKRIQINEGLTNEAFERLRTEFNNLTAGPQYMSDWYKQTYPQGINNNNYSVPNTQGFLTTQAPTSRGFLDDPLRAEYEKSLLRFVQSFDEWSEGRALGGKITETKPYLLHQGEEVITAGETNNHDNRPIEIQNIFNIDLQTTGNVDDLVREIETKITKSLTTILRRT